MKEIERGDLTVQVLLGGRTRKGDNKLNINLSQITLGTI